MAKAMLEVEVPDGAAVGEAVEAEAVAEGEHLRHCHLRHHLRHRLLLLRRAAMSGTQRGSSSCNCASRRVAAFAFPWRLRGC